LTRRIILFSFIYALSIAVLLPTFLSTLAAASAQCTDPDHRPEAVIGQHLAQTAAAEWALKKPQATKKAASSRGFCTRHYDPVCARSKTGETRTFGNKCEAESADWNVTSKGLCDINARYDNDENDKNQ